MAFWEETSHYSGKIPITKLVFFCSLLRLNTLACFNDQQATLGGATRNSPARSIVRCSVGDKTAIAICSLSVREMPCCQLDLEFEESHTVVFSVMGPRGVYLSGYVIAPITVHQDAIVSGREGHEKATTENADCSEHHLHGDELESSKTGPVRDSMEHCDKNMKDEELLLKCYRDKIQQGKIITTLDQKMGMDGKQDTSSGRHEKYINRLHLCTSYGYKEKSIALKWHTVFGRFLGEKRVGAIGKKKKRNRKRKLKLRITEANWSPDTYKGSHGKGRLFGQGKIKKISSLFKA
ncbi:hypothetical protein L1887_11742 [Cichorium endivia]|nr:hypothetical protein L1887_11742 [Cichorium endivia]